MTRSGQRKGWRRASRSSSVVTVPRMKFPVEPPPSAARRGSLRIGGLRLPLFFFSLSRLASPNLRQPESKNMKHAARDPSTSDYRPVALRSFRAYHYLAVLLTHLLLSAGTTYAASATWNFEPISGDWNNASNWTPNMVPNGPADVASFAESNITAVACSTTTEVSAIVFNAGASAFTLTVTADFFTISGQGVTNSSGIMQNFLIPGGTFSGGGGALSFFLVRPLQTLRLPPTHPRSAARALELSISLITLPRGMAHLLTTPAASLAQMVEPRISLKTQLPAAAISPSTADGSTGLSALSWDSLILLVRATPLSLSTAALTGAEAAVWYFSRILPVAPPGCRLPTMAILN